jgi:hypothetical protein
MEYMKTLTEEIENVKESDLEQLAEKFPRGGAIAILENHPEFLSDCKLIQGLSKKSFTILKAYIYLFRGCIQCFERS